MIQRTALPALVCADCGHLAHLHGEVCIGNEECSCTRSPDAINRHAAEVLSGLKAERRHLGYVLLASLVLTLAAGGGSVLASRELAERSIHESEQKLCGMVILSDDTYRANPPTTATGREVAENFRYLRQAYRCSPPK